MTLTCTRCGTSPANLTVIVQRRDGMVDQAPVCVDCHHKTMTELMNRGEDVIGGVIISLDEYERWTTQRNHASELERLTADLHRAFDELKPTRKRRPTYEACCKHLGISHQATRKRWRGVTVWRELTANW